MSAEAAAPARPAPTYSDVGKALGTDYFLLRDQLSEEELDYLDRTRRFVDDELLPAIGDYWERAEFPLELARRLGDPRTLCYVLGARAMPIWSPETLEERLRCAEESVRLADGLGDQLARFHALHWYGVVLVQAGKLEEFQRVITRQQELAARLGEPSARWLARYDAATAAIVAGRLADAE